MEQENKKKEPLHVNQENFVDRIKDLSDNNRRLLARYAGQPYSKVTAKTLMSFYKIGVPEHVDQYKNTKEIYVYVSCLCSKYGTNKGRTFEEQLSKIYHAGDTSDSEKAKIENILDTDWTSNGRLLRVINNYLESWSKEGIRINMGKLLYDLLHWNSPMMYSRKEWATVIANKTVKTKKNNKED